MKKTLTQDIFLFGLAFIAPIQGLLILTWCLLIADMVTGVWAAKKRGEAITSSKMSMTITKIVLYSMALLVTKGAEDVFSILGVVKLTHVAGAVIVAVELKSMYENIYQITGIKIWSYVLSQFKILRDIEKENKTNKTETKR